MTNLSRVLNVFLTLAVLVALVAAGMWIYRWTEEGRILRQMVERLSTDSRIAEVLVTKSEFDEASRKIKTTIKFLEFSTTGQPLPPKYFTFQGNMIQFQSLVVRFDDRLVQLGDKLKGKSLYLFMKVFLLDGAKTQVFNITEPHEIPQGYKVDPKSSEFETKIWENFWAYALNPQDRAKVGIKNAQIEAPGSLFMPGTIYTLRIEHDGGIRIDAAPVPAVLRGETL